MSGTNRYIDGEKGATLVAVQGGVTVELGDFMFIDSAVNLRNDGNSTATLYAYPLEYFRTSGASLAVNQRSVKNYFIGVAIDDHDGKSDSPSLNISIATMGKFKYPLRPARTITPSDYFGISGSTSGSDMFNQKIKRVTDSDYALGTFAELQTRAREACVFINTIVATSVI